MPGIASILNPIVKMSSKGVGIDVNYIAGAENTLITAVNGSGKTSTTIERPLSIFDSKYVSKDLKDENGAGVRLTSAQALMESHQNHILVSAIDFLLDKEYVSDGCDMVMIGKIIDGGNFGSDIHKAVEHGMRFIIPHSSDIYNDIENPYFKPYEALGMKFVEWPDGYGRNPVIRPYTDVKREIEQIAKNAKKPGRTYSITSGKNKDFLNEVRDCTGFDAARYLSIFSKILNAEGLDRFSDKKTEEFYETMVYVPLHDLFLDKKDDEGRSNEENYIDELADFIEKDASEMTLRDASKFLGTRIRDTSTLNIQLESLTQFEADRNKAQSHLDDLFSHAVVDRLQTEDTINREKQKAADLALKIQEKNYMQASQRLYEFRDKRDKAFDEAEQTQSVYEMRKQESLKADFELSLAKFNTQHRTSLQRKGELDAAIEALREKESQDEGSKLVDLAFTLQSKHVDRLKDARAEVTAEQNHINELGESLDVAEQKVVDLTEKQTAAKVTKGTIKGRQSDRFKEVKKIEWLVSPKAFDNKSKTVLKSVLDEKLAILVEDRNQASNNADKMVSEIESAKQRIIKIESEARIAEEDVTAKEGSLGGLNANLEKVNEARRNLEPYSDLVQAPDLKTDIEKEISRLKDQSNCLKDKENELVSQQKNLSGQKEAAEAGKLFLPDAATEMLEREGVPYQTGESYLRSLCEEVGEASMNGVLERIPYLASSIIVNDADVSRIRDLLGSEPQTEWFAGAVPVVAMGACESHKPVEGLAVAHLDRDYLIDPKSYIEHLDRQIAESTHALEENQAKQSRIQTASNLERDYARTLDSSGFESVSSLMLAIDEASELLKASKEILQSKQDEKVKAEHQVETYEHDFEKIKESISSLDGNIEVIKGAISKAEEIIDLVKKINVENKTISSLQREIDDFKCQMETLKASQKTAENSLREKSQYVITVQSELNDVNEPAEGNILEGEFDALLTEYRTLKIRRKEELAPLSQKKRKAEEDYRKQREAENAQRADAEKILKSYCDCFSHVSFQERKEEWLVIKEPPSPAEMVQLEKCKETARDNLSDATSERNRTKEKYEEAAKTLTEEEGNFQSNYGGREIYPNRDDLLEKFGPIIKMLKDEQKRCLRATEDEEARISLLKGSIDKMENAGAVQKEEDGISRCERIIDTKTFNKEAEEAITMITQSGKNLEDAKSRYLDLAGKFSDIEKKNAATLEKTGDVVASIVGHVNVATDYVNGKIELGSVKKDLKIVSSNMRARRSAIDDSLRMKDVGLEAVIKNLLGTLNESIHYLRGLVKASNGAIDIPCLKTSYKRSDFEEKFSEKIKEILHSMSDQVGKSEDGATASRNSIEEDLRSRIVNIRALIAMYVQFAYGQQRSFSMRFRSTAVEDDGKMLTWARVQGLSGGERAQVFFTMLTLLAKTTVDGDEKTKTCFVLLDNPFANLTDDDRWDACFDVAKINKMQVIATRQPSGPSAAIDYFPYRHTLMKVKSGKGYTQKTETDHMPDEASSVMITHCIAANGNAGTARLF